jgi:hypothetical protein
LTKWFAQLEDFLLGRHTILSASAWAVLAAVATPNSIHSAPWMTQSADAPKPSDWFAGFASDDYNAEEDEDEKLDDRRLLEKRLWTWSPKFMLFKTLMYVI